MSTTTIDRPLYDAQLAAIDESGWGIPFHVFQPRNPVFWIFAWSLVAAAVHFAHFLEPQVANYGGSFAAGGIVFAIYTIPWLMFLHAKDRYTSLPPKLLATGFVWGAVVATFLLAVTANDAVLHLYSKAFGSGWTSDWGAGLTAPFTEEFAKALGLIVLIGLAPKLITSAYHGFIIGAFIGLGFQVSEDALYVYQGAAGSFGTAGAKSFVTITVLRGTVGIVSHTLFAALVCTGIMWILGRAGQQRHTGRGLLAILAGVVFHGVWDDSGALGNALGGPVVVYLITAVVAITVVVFVARAASPDEQRWMHDLLAPEAAAGTISTGELEAVAGSRRARRRYLKSLADHRQRRREKHVFEAIHDLARDLARTHGTDSIEVVHDRSEIARLRAA